MTTLYIDTETGPTRRQDVAAWLAAKHFDAEDITGSAKKAAAALEKTSLQPTLCELWVVSYAVDDSEPKTLISTGDEADLVGRLAATLDVVIGEARQPISIVAYNEEFDRSVIRVRAMAHGVQLHALVRGDGKPWERVWRCAMAPLRMGRDGVSLEQACVGFGIPLTFGEAGDLPGREVGAAIARGELERVAHHCALDVRRVREVWRRIMSIGGSP
jgi:hypothetical protein